MGTYCVLVRAFLVGSGQGCPDKAWELKEKGEAGGELESYIS